MTETIGLLQEHAPAQRVTENAQPIGFTALELLAESVQPATLDGRPGDPPPTPPQRFETAPQVTPYDIYGNPDYEPDEDWLYE